MHPDFRRGDLRLVGFHNRGPKAEEFKAMRLHANGKAACRSHAYDRHTKTSLETQYALTALIPFSSERINYAAAHGAGASGGEKQWRR